MIQNLALNGIAGAITGYITNNIAIKMLFKEYFGFGGVIEKEYESFIENISVLIEKDLINHETLKPELTSEKFKKVLEEIIKTFLVLELPSLTNKPLYDFKGYEESLNNIVGFIDKYKENLIKETVQIYLNKPLNYYISDEQFKYIILRVDIAFSENKKELESILFDNISNKQLNDLISNRVFSEITNNVKEIIQRVDFREFDGDFNKIYNKFVEIIDIDNVLITIQEDLKNSNIKEFINDSSNLSYELLNRVIKLLQSPNGQQLLEVAVSHLLKLLKDIDLNLKDILGDETMSKFVSFLNKELPIFIDLIVKEIKNDKSELESLINNTIDDYLDSSLFGKFFKFLKNSFIGNVASKKNVIAKILDFILNYRDEASNIVTQKLIEYLTNNSVGNIISDLEKEGLISKKQIATLIQLNLNNLKAKRVNFIDEFLDKKVGEVYDVDLSFVKNQTLPTIFNYVKENYLYKDKFQTDIDKSLKNVILSLKDKTVDEFIDKLSLDIDLKSHLHKFYPKLNAKLKDFTNLEIDFNVKDIIRNYEDKKVSSLILPFQTENNYKVLSENIVHLLNNNLATLLEGKISVAVSNELHKFEPSQIKDMVENFMGKELAPINILGAFLGGVAGAGYYMATLPFNNPALKMATPAIYGITGVATNWLAIKMLFRPYEKKWYLPAFSPGIVAKKKANFAENIANFVKNDILTDEAMLKIYESKENFIKTSLKEYILKDNFKIIDDNLKLYNQTLSNITFDKIIEFIEQNRDKISAYLIKILDEKKDILIDKTPKISQEILKELLKTDFSQEIEKYIISSLDNKNIKEYIPMILNQIDKNIDVIFDKIIMAMDFNNIKKIILGFEAQYQEYIQNHTLKEFIPTKKVSNSLSNKVIEIVSSDKFIDDIFDKLKNSYINPDEKLKYAFNSMIETAMYKNIDYLINMAITTADNYKSEVKREATKDVSWYHFGAKGKIEGAIDAVFSKALPTYLNRKKPFIRGLADRLLNYRLKDIGITHNALKDNLIKEKVVNIVNDYNFKSNVDKLSFAIVDTILTMDLKTTLQLLNIRNLRQLIDIVSPVLENGFGKIEYNIKQNQEIIPEITKSFVKIVLEDISRREKMLNLIKGIDLKNEIEFSVNKLKRDNILLRDIENFLEDFIYKFLEKDFYSKEILQNDFNKIILNLDKDRLKEIFIPFLGELFIELNHLFDEDLKKEFVDILTDAFFNSLKIHLGEVIETIDIQEIIKREINQMHPKEIEELFQSFAGDYFKKLTLYGVGGAVFGIPSVFL